MDQARLGCVNVTDGASAPAASPGAALVVLTVPALSLVSAPEQAASRARRPTQASRDAPRRIDIPVLCGTADVETMFRARVFEPTPSVDGAGQGRTWSPRARPFGPTDRQAAVGTTGAAASFIRMTVGTRAIAAARKDRKMPGFLQVFHKAELYGAAALNSKLDEKMDARIQLDQASRPRSSITTR